MKTTNILLGIIALLLFGLLVKDTDLIGIAHAVPPVVTSKVQDVNIAVA